MRRGIAWLLSAIVAAALAATSASAARADQPALKAKQQEAAAVLEEISALDERLSVLSERYDGARERLHAVEARLRNERVALRRARAQYRRALDRLARLLVSLYTGETPSSLDAILGAQSFGELLTIADAQTAVARERSEIATTAKLTRQRVEAAFVALQADRAQAARTVRDLAQTQGTLEAGLAQRERLLASVRTQIARLQAQELARQQRLLAAARARLAAAARAAQARAAAARREAHARAAERRARMEAAARAAAPTPSASRAPVPPPVAVTPPATTDSSPPATTTTDASPTAAPPPTATDSPGHPQAAEVALGYLGVPYQWGGGTPAGFDCSGLVSYVFAQLGVELPHYAAAQYGYGTPVSRDQLQPGDLVFFDNLAHVGIYIGGGEFVDAPHAGTFVRIESLDDPWYATRYVGARRI